MLNDGFYLVTLGGDYLKFAARLTQLTKYPQNPVTPDEMEFVCDSGTPLAPLGEVIYVQRGAHIYHGMVVSKNDSGDSQTVQCKSMQWLLGYRYIPEFIYHASNLNTILGSGTPSTTIGALFWINSLIPSGKWTAYSATVAKLAGAGLKSIIGSKALYASTSYPNAGTIDGCDGVKVLSQAASASLAANQYYRDNDDLYVRLGDGSYLPNAFMVAVANAFDTKIRLGTISIGTYVAASDFSLKGQAAASFDSLFENCGLECQFLPWHDGYVYLNLAATIARGTEANPSKTYTDGYNCTILLSSTNDPNFQAVIGYDSSNENTATNALIDFDWSSRGPQLFSVIDTQGADKDDASRQLTWQLANNDDSFTVKTNEIDYFLKIGDWIKLVRDDLGTFSVRVQLIEITDGLMILTCGKKVFSASKTFGQFLKRSEISMRQPIQVTQLTNGAGTFVVYSANLSGLRIFYEESISVKSDDTQAQVGAFLDISIDGKVVPPGRIKLSSGSAISVDITDYCNIAGTHTVTRNLYLGTGWESIESYIKQYKARQFIAP